MVVALLCLQTQRQQTLRCEKTCSPWKVQLQAEDQAVWQEMKRREEQRLQREKAVLSRQSQVLLKLPTKREKAEVRLHSVLQGG